MSEHAEAGEELVHDALAAMERRDCGRLKPLLHPYLRCTSTEGETFRGRKKVMGRLLTVPTSTPPSACELRDGADLPLDGGLGLAYGPRVDNGMTVVGALAAARHGQAAQPGRARGGLAGWCPARETG